MNSFLENNKGPEWAKYIKAAIIIYRNEVLPYIESGLEKNEEYAFEAAAMELEKAKFALMEGVKNFPVIPGNAIIFNSRYIILPRFNLLINSLLEDGIKADDKKEQERGIKFAVEDLKKKN